MKFGMRVRGGALAALIMFAVPVVATLTTLVSSPAVAQTVTSIVVEGNRRVEIETIRSYFHAGPGGRYGEAARDALQQAAVPRLRLLDHRVVGEDEDVDRGQ